MKLGVNIDHIAVLREARKVNDPDILEAMYEAIKAKADQITIHLREDRRHINEIDVKNIINFCKIPVNVECALNEDITEILLNLKPHRVTIVPEKREELTTEGGLNLKSKNLKSTIQKYKNKNIKVSLFVDPIKDDMQECKNLGADMVELHTGAFANINLMLNANLSKTKYKIDSLNFSREILENLEKKEFEKLLSSAKKASEIGLLVAAGHGLNYQNIEKICQIKEICELNIGQSIIAKAVFIGLEKAIKKMKKCIK